MLLRRVCTCCNETQKIDSWLKQINETRSHKAYSLLTVFVVCQLLLCGTLGQEVLFKLWFQRRDGKPCVFEHVFLGISVAFGIGFIHFRAELDNYGLNFEAQKQPHNISQPHILIIF